MANTCKLGRFFCVIREAVARLPDTMKLNSFDEVHDNMCKRDQQNDAHQAQHKLATEKNGSAPTYDAFINISGGAF